mmetsp:Transcript_11474/g.35424  ORF Transcript_11474/g.35424 Transcript_11474/m.35424 type:complete len:204 (-) Transcript_11474:231-842(-)
MDADELPRSVQPWRVTWGVQTNQLFAFEQAQQIIMMVMMETRRGASGRVEVRCRRPGNVTAPRGGAGRRAISRVYSTLRVHFIALRVLKCIAVVTRPADPKINRLKVECWQEARLCGQLTEDGVKWWRDKIFGPIFQQRKGLSRHVEGGVAVAQPPHEVAKQDLHPVAPTKGLRSRAAPLDAHASARCRFLQSTTNPSPRRLH